VCKRLFERKDEKRRRRRRMRKRRRKRRAVNDLRQKSYVKIT